MTTPHHQKQSVDIHIERLDDDFIIDRCFFFFSLAGRVRH